MLAQSPLALGQPQHDLGLKQDDSLGFDMPAHKQTQDLEFRRYLQQADEARSSNRLDEALSMLDEARLMLQRGTGSLDIKTQENEPAAGSRKEPTKVPRRDKLTAHAAKHHNVVKFEPTEINNVRQELACPTQCLLCPRDVQSWDEFYNCLATHSEIDNPPINGETLWPSSKAGQISKLSRHERKANESSDQVPESRSKRPRIDDYSSLKPPPPPKPQPEPAQKCPRCPHIVNKCSQCFREGQCHKCAADQLAVQSPGGHPAPVNQPIAFQGPSYVNPRDLTTPGYFQSQGFGQDMQAGAASFPTDPYTYTGAVFSWPGSQGYRTGTRNARYNSGNLGIGDDPTIMIATVPEPNLPLLYDSRLKGPSVMGPSSVLRRLGKWINPLATKSQSAGLPMELLSSVLPGTWDYLSFVPPQSSPPPLPSTIEGLEPVPECNCPCRAMPRPQYIARTRKALSPDRDVELTFKVAVGDTDTQSRGPGHSHALRTTVQVVVRLLKLRSSVAAESSDKKQMNKVQEGDTDETAEASSLEPSSSRSVTAFSSSKEELEGEWAFTTDLEWLLQKLLDSMNGAGGDTSSKLIPHDADDELKSVYVLIMHVVLFFLNIGHHAGGMLLTE
ncbi:uncharacterized protein PFLUO_LOCUS655 [Penicillium psychrofluorescens]|uniref:uncharacterized protein n=1 Tax=Penicillium psychrofluorescens TaxID=3158075 RepID=UPI003CCD1157